MSTNTYSIIQPTSKYVEVDSTELLNLISKLSNTSVISFKTKEVVSFSYFLVSSLSLDSSIFSKADFLSLQQPNLVDLDRYNLIMFSNFFVSEYCKFVFASSFATIEFPNFPISDFKTLLEFVVVFYLTFLVLYFISKFIGLFES